MSDNRPLDSVSLAPTILSAEYGTHGIFICRGLGVFRSTLAGFCKNALPDGEIVVILSHYDTVDQVRDLLEKLGLEGVEQYQKAGTLFILNSVDGYLINPSGVFDLARSLVQRASKENRKNGVTVLADMGAFFAKDKINELIKYESLLPTKYEGNLKGYCFYLQSDFARLSSTQQAILLDGHGKKNLGKNESS